VSTTPAQYIEPTRTGFRIAVLVFAAILVLEAVWLLAPAFTLLAGRPVSANAAPRTGTCDAARLAFVRGDLWTECALAQDPFQPSQQAGAPALARAAAERAAALAPHNAMAWLIIASSDSRFDWLNPRVMASLKMSYYTGSNEPALIPWRLRVVAGSDALADDDLQQLIRHEIRTIITHRPELKPAISAAYRDASAAGKRLLESAVSEVDPNLVAPLRAGVPLR
jgi:hypothetical protein